MINKAVVHYKSKQQPLVTLSSTEAEFVALAFGLVDTQLIVNMLLEMNLQVTEKLIYDDNQGAIKIAKAEHGSACTRHLHVKL